MGDKTVSRRDVVKMAKTGGLIAAGLGLAQLVGANGDRTESAEMIDNGDGTWTVTQEMANRMHQLGIKNGGYGIIIFRLSDVIVSSSHALPLDGDFAAAKSDSSAKIAMKVTGKRGKTFGQVQGALLEFQIPEK